MGPGVRRDDVDRYVFAISPRIAPEACRKLPALINRGRREDRVLAAPAVSRADCAKQNAHEHTGSAETLRPSLRNGFTAYFVLSPVNGLLATVVPQRRYPLRNVTPPPRRQDHTTSPYVQATLVKRTLASTATRPSL